MSQTDIFDTSKLIYEKMSVAEESVDTNDNEEEDKEEMNEEDTSVMK